MPKPKGHRLKFHAIPGTRVSLNHRRDQARPLFIKALIAVDPEALLKFPELQAWADEEPGGWTGRSWHPDRSIQINNDIAAEVKAGTGWYKSPDHFDWLARVKMGRSYAEIADDVSRPRQVIRDACIELAALIELPLE